MNRRARSYGFACASLAAVLAACAQGGDTSTDGTVATYDGDGGGGGTSSDGGAPPINGHGPSDAAVDAVEAGPPCDTTALPADTPCLVAEAYGVFVAPRALAPVDASTSNGSRAAPFATIAEGLTVASATHKRLYVCAATYAEAVTLRDGVSMFGYFDCASGVWTKGAARTVVAPTTSPAVRATSIVAATRIEGFELVAPDFGALAPSPTAAARSSIALFATGSPGLTLVGSRLHAGTAQNGGDGAFAIMPQGDLTAAHGVENVGAQYCNQSSIVDRNACDASHAGSVGGTSVCAYPGLSPVPAVLIGGPGGKGGIAGRRYLALQGTNLVPMTVAGGFGEPAASTPQTAHGAVSSVGLVAAAGATGAEGTDGASAAGLGTFVGNDYAPADGATGSHGAGGQGGGGGAGDGADSGGALNMNAWGYSGSGGGAGGCGGPAGSPGRGGGASIALVALESPIVVTSSALEADTGGLGGSGQFGSTGSAGGAPGLAAIRSAATANVWIGAAGGAGGVGGASGHGSPGPTLGIAFTGTAPTQTSTTITLGSAAAGRVQSVRDNHAITATTNAVRAETQAF